MAIYAIVMYCLRLFIVVLQELHCLPNYLHICDRLQEKGPCAAKNTFSVNAGFCKYDAIATSIENLILIGL